MIETKRTGLSLVAGLCLLGMGSVANAAMVNESGALASPLGGGTTFTSIPDVDFSAAPQWLVSLTDTGAPIFGAIADLTLAILPTGGGPAVFTLEAGSSPGTFTGSGTYDLFILGNPSSFGGLVDIGTFNVSASPVPVPAAVILFGSAITGLLAVGRRQRRSMPV